MISPTKTYSRDDTIKKHCRILVSQELGTPTSQEAGHHVNVNQQGIVKRFDIVHVLSTFILRESDMRVSPPFQETPDDLRATRSGVYNQIVVTEHH